MARAMQNKPLIIGISVGFVLFGLLVFLNPKPIDWSLSFSKKDKIPYGNSILYELLPILYPETEITETYTSLKDYIDNTIPKNTNYLVINNEYQPDSTEVNVLISMVKNGNFAFITANQFSDAFCKKLHLEFNKYHYRNIIAGDSTTLNFANRQLKSAFGYSYKKMLDNTYITSYDTAQTTVLGYNQNGQTTFIRIHIGDGSLFINTSPLAFCNYSMLKNDHHEYIFKSLSYLPRNKVIWDEHYKPINETGRSTIEFILKNTSLKYAWYVLLAGIFIFFIFETKRRQRTIPVVLPPENTSLKFIDTIGRLYFNRKNHLDLAQKKYIYFIDYIRSTYHINIKEMTEEGYNELSQKSSIPIRTITQIIEMGERLNSIDKLTEEDLIQFNQKIEFFYQQSK